MKFTLTAAALVAAVAANPEFVPWSELGHAKVVNRCPYTVYLWSIDKEMGCAPAHMQTLKPGGEYSEQFRKGTSDGGISIKLSKFQTCGGKDITQLEYKIRNEEEGNPQFAYNGNFLDMSFVDCLNNLEDCPGRTDGFYLKSGNNNLGAYKSEVNNEHCPVFNVHDAEQAVRVSYILPDDPQTKWCNQKADLDLYLCGGQAPGAEPISSPSSSASSSSEVESTSSPSSAKEEEPTPTPAPSSTEEAFVVAAAAAVTPAPAPAGPVIKTEVVYVTEYVNRRHAHGRRHQRHRA